MATLLVFLFFLPSNVICKIPIHLLFLFLANLIFKCSFYANKVEVWEIILKLIPVAKDVNFYLPQSQLLRGRYRVRRELYSCIFGDVPVNPMMRESSKGIQGAGNPAWVREQSEHEGGAKGKSREGQWTGRSKGVGEIFRGGYWQDLPEGGRWRLEDA